jgi:ubiquinone/menaquinone biosynthesis C-methylase UbiE
MKKDITTLIRSLTGEQMQYFNELNKEYLQTSTGLRYNIEDNIILFPENTNLIGNNGNYQKLYDRMAGFYDIITGVYAFIKNGNEKNRLMQYLSLLDVKNKDRVIEISIGTGRNIKYLNPGAEYYGIDVSLGMLKKCRKNMEKLRREITLIQAEAEFLPLANESFDVVFSAGGFNFFNDPAKAVKEMCRVAKSGAKILITDETENFRLKHQKNTFYKDIKIKNPVEYLPEHCKDVDYNEICNGDLYTLTFQK